MARFCVFASGNGSNFEAIARKVYQTHHSLEFLLCNKREAYALKRADSLGIKSYVVEYSNKSRQQAETEILEICVKHSVKLIALAGFMKLLSPYFLKNFKGPILNIHPSLLPKYPGVDAIKRSYEAGEEEMGISIIQIDEGCDTGPILFQTKFKRWPGATLEKVEEEIHRLEHLYYPSVLVKKLEELD